MQEMLAKCGSQLVFNTIPKFKEIVVMNCAINALKGFLLTFYILRGENLQEDYIKDYKLGIGMEMHKKVQMIMILFKEFLSFFKR